MLTPDLELQEIPLFTKHFIYSNQLQVHHLPIVNRKYRKRNSAETTLLQQILTIGIEGRRIGAPESLKSEVNGVQLDQWRGVVECQCHIGHTQVPFATRVLKLAQILQSS